ncbi:DUF1963 domain-containing protein [Kluyvera georgiana]|uniref:DUF1963 domain-containing protein n=1 Tax=Kluyvera georgiana TaxID=73098 RepID=UPI0023035ED2|nr:DUF1963 domain-containing protein [Kluyvera georgiana]MDA8493362.1 YwqG family protein [Kluyvera georgiana]
MDDRLPCKKPDCSHRILPATAARTGGYCMPCVQACEKQKYDEYIKKNKKTINVFEGINDPVEMLKRIHQPRKHDPLISWTPCPIATDALYQQLSADQAQQVADYAEMLFDDGEYNEAIEIYLCLAAFTHANLDNCLRKWVYEGDIDIYSALPFHRAPADVRDNLLQRVEHDADNRNWLLTMLAWIGDDVVVERFNYWRKEPPAWCDSLYIPPQNYSYEAGWELTPDGHRRNLYFSSCTHLSQHAKAQPAVFRTVSQHGEHCPHCTLPLINLFEIAPKQVDPTLESWPGSIRIMTCECCSAYETVFARIDHQGQPQWYEKNKLSALAVKNANDWMALPADHLHLSESRLPLFAADQFLPTTFSQLGGHPTWIQDAQYPSCPECARHMMFIAQLSCHDVDEYLEGIIYGFICPTCHTTATSFQQT